jgi:hypothetical protein
MAADCKSARLTPYGGSNPSPSTTNDGCAHHNRRGSRSWSRHRRAAGHRGSADFRGGHLLPARASPSRPTCRPGSSGAGTALGRLRFSQRGSHGAVGVRGRRPDRHPGQQRRRLGTVRAGSRVPPRALAPCAGRRPIRSARSARALCSNYRAAGQLTRSRLPARPFRSGPGTRRQSMPTCTPDGPQVGEMLGIRQQYYRSSEAM